MPIPQMTQSPQSWKQDKPTKKKKKGLLNSFLKDYSKAEIIRLIIIIFLICFVTGSILIVGMFAWFSKSLPEPDKLIDRTVPESTKIMDRTGEKTLYEIRGDEKRTIVDLDEVSPYIVWATLAAEDKNFYEHRGISITGIFRAILKNIISGKFTQGEGGSTITQQLIKNTILTNEKKVIRKLKEWVLAYQIEKKFTKDQILNLYLNEIPYGHPNYGIESASQAYFNKPSSEVSIAQAAMLASVPQATSKFHPVSGDWDALMARKNWVIDQMAEAKFITQEEANAAKDEEIIIDQDLGEIIAPHFVFYVQKVLADKYSPQELREGGFNITTTLDYDKQMLAEESIKDHGDIMDQYGAKNCALLSVDAKTGQILAYVGSRDFNNDDISGKFDVVSQGLRQPGSSFKPIVYTELFNKGYTTETVLYDVVTNFAAGGKSYIPLNYNLKEYGPVTVRKALAGSLNISAVKALYLAGINNVIDLANDLGYTTLNKETDYGLSLVLGGGEVYLIDQVSAYATLAREGEKHQITPILKIEDKNGKILEEYKENKERVLDKNVVRKTNSILSDNASRTFAFGASNPLTLPDRPACAKTGTTNEYADAWTIGYTPSIVTGVWVGNPTSAEKMKNGAYGSVLAGPIWQQYMINVTKGTPVENFNAPPGIPEDYPPYLRGVTEEMEVVIDKASGKLATELTPESYRETKKFALSHSILHYIDKNDPLGGSPEDPTADPQYQLWENAIIKWAEENEMELDMPPAEEDDLHIEENMPSLSISSPSNNQTIDQMPLQVRIEASAPRGVRRVEYYLDDELLDTVFQAPFNLSTNVVGFSKGFYTLKVVAYDDIDNSKTEEITINLTANSGQPSLNWITPRQDASFYRSVFPLTVTVELDTLRTIKSINFYLIDQANNQSLITKVSELNQKRFNINWLNPPNPGQYRVVAEIELESGNKYQSNSLNITLLD